MYSQLYQCIYRELSHHIALATISLRDKKVIAYAEAHYNRSSLRVHLYPVHLLHLTQKAATTLPGNLPIKDMSESTAPLLLIVAINGSSRTTPGNQP